MEISNLLLGMSYNMPNMLSSEFQSHSIKIKDFKNIAINSFSPIKPITRIVSKVAKELKTLH